MKRLSHYSRQCNLTSNPRALSADKFYDTVINTTQIRVMWNNDLEYVFMYDGSRVLPMYGSNMLLGYMTAFVVKPRPYTLNEFIMLLGDNNIDHITCTYEEGEAPLHKSLFDVVTVEDVIDYGKIITELEDRGTVQTRESTNVMTTDGRQFLIAGEDEWYEVDFLGTNLGQELSDHIVRLWSVTGIDLK